MDYGTRYHYVRQSIFNKRTLISYDVRGAPLIWWLKGAIHVNPQAHIR
jgi:hypothetical protein